MISEDITLIPDRRAGDSTAAALIVVLGGESLQSVELPDGGSLVVGREVGVDVRVDDATVSRRHAVISARAGEITLRDLSSQNGSRIRGVTVSHEHRVSIGDVIEIGNSCLLVQHPQSVLRALGGRGDFERQLGEACAAQRHAGEGLGVAILRANAAVAVARDVMRSVLRPSDVIHELERGELAAICLGATARAMGSIAERLRAELTARGLSGFAGAATLSDGASPAEMILAAQEALRRSSPEPLPEKQRSAPVVRSPAMHAVYSTAQSVAGSNISVLITGETGSGKQVLAEAVHAASPRRSLPFVRINCAAMPEQLLEAELFGYERGAFTGAVKDKIGLLEHAAGGTFMLDEIGDMPLGLQAKLLQVLEDKRLRRVGGLDLRQVDVRVIAATNRDPEKLVEQGLFRADLFWRLCGIMIEIPPLRNRREDIVPLAERFLDSLSDEMRRPRPRLSPESARVLFDHDWPGNVRQLRNVMERSFLTCTGGELRPEDSAQPLLTGASRTRATMATTPMTEALPVRQELIALERERILAALRETENNQTRAAELLGMPRRTLLEKLDRYGVARPRKAKDPR